MPDIEVESYWTRFRIITLYHEHAISEQFMSEIKSRTWALIQREVCPNDLLLHLGIFAYNILRYLGQTTIQVKGVSLRKKVQRHRILTVIQGLVIMAPRLVAP